MCGIIGFLDKKNPRLTHQLLKQINHRGYDETIYYFYKGVNLGMNRLAIVDLNKNLYPMQYKNYVLIFNGEIYNYLNFKNQLMKEGIKFNSHSDAEIILPLYDKYGPKAFKLLEGMFALCILDKQKQQIILSRDKSGQKPLYYSKSSKGFIFSSEIKTIIQFNKRKSIPLIINQSSLIQGLIQGFTADNKTLILNINKLRPSSYLKYDIKSKKTKINSYWQPNLSKNNFIKIAKTNKKNSLSLLVKNLDNIIKESTQKRLLADVPIGCFLSGGVDSSLLAYYIRQKINNLKTFSVSFSGSIKDNEGFFSKKVSRWLKTKHTQINCTAGKILPIINNIGKYIDEPVYDAAVLPTFLLAQEARKQVKVVLTGEGADELFAGYHRYIKELWAKKINQSIILFPILKKLRNIVAATKYEKIFTDLQEHYAAQNIWKPKELNRLLKIKISSKPIPISFYLKKYANARPLLAMQLTDYRNYLAEQLLMKIDKITMSNNLEARTPYLDTKIINFSFNLPYKYKVKIIHGKYLLKKVAEQYFPKYFVWRPKHGFTVPLDRWFRQELKDCVYQSLEDLKNYKSFINTNYYAEIIRNHMDKKQNYKDKIWSIIVLTKWLKYHKISF